MNLYLFYLLTLIISTGLQIGIYFFEELKAVVKLGYQITLIKGYEFTKDYLFTKDVNIFYGIKKTTSGAEKLIAKLLLNNIYGYFGRKQINILTQNVKNSELKGLLLTRIIKSITKINNEYSTVLTYTYINYQLLKKIYNVFHNNLTTLNIPVKSNVAIAAVIAYARIHMIYYKLLPSTLYTDTASRGHSIFTTINFNLPNLK